MLASCLETCPVFEINLSLPLFFEVRFQDQIEKQTWINVKFPNRIARFSSDISADHVNIWTVYRQRVAANFWRLKLTDVQIILRFSVCLHLKIKIYNLKTQLFLKTWIHFLKRVSKTKTLLELKTSVLVPPAIMKIQRSIKVTHSWRYRPIGTSLLSLNITICSKTFSHFFSTKSKLQYFWFKINLTHPG